MSNARFVNDSGAVGDRASHFGAIAVGHMNAYSIDSDSFVEPRSVSQLIASRLDPVDPWRLALVQRHLVWDEIRISGLLDSLLAGYPIGSLLVCRVRQDAHVLVESGGTRRAQLADAGTWQLLDGQQRVNALVCLFTEQGQFGRFHLDMTRTRVPEELVTRRRDKRHALDYITWRPDDAGGTEPIDGRERYIDLSRLQAWTATMPEGALEALVTELDAGPEKTIEVLNAIDPSFADELHAAALAQATDRLVRLLRAWMSPSIPVQHFTVDSPLDVLQVFTRINLAGVRLDGEDVFFAAVKTEWPAAEEHLDRVAAASPLLNRMTALRILARLASRARSKEDLLPLRVDRLNGPKGKQLIETMQQLAADQSPVMVRLGVLGRLLTTESAIGYGLRLIDDKLLDHVFGWAAVNESAADEGYVRDHLPAIEAYLVGAHAFRYSTIFLDGYLRLAFAEGVAAGAAGETFPTERIVAGARRRWENLKRGQQWVAPVETDDDKRRLVDPNTGLFLSILQRLPYQPPPRDPDDPRAGHREVEWDHIYPQAQANRMRVRNDGGRLSHHPDRRLVWSGGNLWALDRPINNAASDRLPSAKFAMLDGLPVPGRLPTLWPAVDDVALTRTERADLLAAEERLTAQDVEAAMPHFRAYVVARGLRMYHEVVGRYPDVELFAPSTVVDQDAFEDAPIIDLKANLGIDDSAVDVDEPAEIVDRPAFDPANERFAAVLATADAAGVGAELRAIVATASDLGLAVRPNRGSVMIAPPTNRTRMLFTVWPQAAKAGGRLSIYRWAPAIAEFFPVIDEAVARDQLGPDGFGVLERDAVPAFIETLRSLLEPALALGGTSAGSRSLSGAEIRGIASDWLRANDPDRHGVHYYEIAHAVQARGIVGGTDQMAVVLGAMRGGEAMFEAVGPGTYTWAAPPTGLGTTRGRRYWAMRTDVNARDRLWPEILAGRLRQGWGWDPEMDLELVADLVSAGRPLTAWQQDAWANRRMLTTREDAIHVGDIVLVPHMPELRRFSLVRVVAAYRYDGGQAFGDYGHILPVELLTDAAGIGYTDQAVAPKLQTSLGNRIRLWNLDAFGPEFERLLSMNGVTTPPPSEGTAR